MKKGSKYYTGSFTININNYDKYVAFRFFAYNIEDALDKLPEVIQKRIGYISESIKNIHIYRKNEIDITFYNWEEMIQQLTVA